MIGVRLVGRFDEPRLVPAPQQPGELARIDTRVGVVDLFGQHGTAGPDAVPPRHGAGDGRDRRQIGPLRLARPEGGRQLRPPREHQVSGRIMAVVRVRQRADQGPVLAALGQHRQVLADLHAGSARRDRVELPLEFDRPVRLHVEGVVLRRPASEEQKDHRPPSGPSAPGGGPLPSAGTAGLGPASSPRAPHPRHGKPEGTIVPACRNAKSPSPLRAGRT